MILLNFLNNVEIRNVHPVCQNLHLTSVFPSNWKEKKTELILFLSLVKIFKRNSNALIVLVEVFLFYLEGNTFSILFLVWYCT